METFAGIEARWVWALLSLGASGALEEPVADYGGMLEQMEAEDLLVLLGQVRERLKAMGVSASAPETMPDSEAAAPVELFIDRRYTIRMGAPDGPVLPLRPLVKTLFILFLRHPEGILLKERDKFRRELEEIYTIISPAASREDVLARVGRLVDIQDNSFSEKASVLNARLEELLPSGLAEVYKIQGYNGHPRRVPLNPLLVHWSGEE